MVKMTDQLSSIAMVKSMQIPDYRILSELQSLWDQAIVESAVDSSEKDANMVSREDIAEFKSILGEYLIIL